MKHKEGIWMSKKGQMYFDTVSEFLRGSISRQEAASLLTTTERTISRVARRIESRGASGVVNANQGRRPWNRLGDELRVSVMKLICEKYFDCNVTHAHELLKKNHGISVGYDSLRRWCHDKGMVKRAKRRRPIARYKRVRMPCEGLLLQMDGSPYRYNGKDVWSLIAAIDDATSEIPYGEFFLTEDTLSCMRVLQRIIELKGIPHALYVDGAGWLGGSTKRAHFTQFVRACDELGISVIRASSPEAKGRIERAWNTIQDRLVPELRMRNIKSMPKANDYLQTQFLPNYWKKELTLPARHPERKYRPQHESVNLREILCLKDFRSVQRDHTISWAGQEYEVISPFRHAIWGQKLEFRTYQDLTWTAYFADKPIEIKLTEKKLLNQKLPTQIAA